jgi:hypothetical protein
MKNYLAIAVCALALALPARAQYNITNTVTLTVPGVFTNKASTVVTTNNLKTSAVGDAGAVNGSDTIVIAQGTVTKKASIAQIIAAAAAVGSQASNYLSLVITTNAAKDYVVAVFATNGFNTVNAVEAATTAATRAALEATNSAILNYEYSVTSALDSKYNTASNALHVALDATNTILAARIDTVSALVGGSTNGGSMSLARLSLATFTMPDVLVTTSGTTSNALIDFSQGSQQKVLFNPSYANNAVQFVPTNWRDGDNVWLWVHQPDVFPCYVGSVSNGVSGATLESFDNTFRRNNAVGTSNKDYMLNWQVFGTNIIFGITPHQ